MLDVPKWSTLDSVSFIIFLSDLSDICNAFNYASYADDTTPYAFRQIYTEATKFLDRNINKIYAWIKHNLFLENSIKAHILINLHEKISLKILHSTVKFSRAWEPLRVAANSEPNFHKLIMLLRPKLIKALVLGQKEHNI